MQSMPKEEKNKFSFRILFTIIFDIIVVAMSFFFSYTYFTGHITGKLLGMKEFILALGIYVLTFLVVSLLCGSYRKKVLRSLYL